MEGAAPSPAMSTPEKDISGPSVTSGQTLAKTKLVAPEAEVCKLSS